ncbi:MAG TPA: hypothetical protein VGT40_24465 [Methylomirabilota bacterium]|jgi:hypothetical protein|nr:hypothetical protein [Methylomirabilota bacterium]
MSFAYSPMFAVSVTAGYLLTVLGALLSLAAAVWWMLAREWEHGRPPLGFRALATAAFSLFVVGIFWQLIGYVRLTYANVW